MTKVETKILDEMYVQLVNIKDKAEAPLTAHALFLHKVKPNSSAIIMTNAF